MNNKAQQTDELLAKVLGTDPSSGRSRKRKRMFLALAVIAVVAGGILLSSWLRKNGTKTEYVTVDAVRGNLTVAISATGNLAPIKQIDVGSEVSGLVASVYVDDNDKVTKGQLLAQIDLSKLNDEVARAKAGVTSAEAKLGQTQATVAESRANLARLREVLQLSGGKVPAKTEIDAAEANFQRAVADEASAKGSVANTRAELSVNQTNIKKATIASPVDGVVLERKIEPGQTIQASFSAPVLFTIAENLAQMKLEVDVDEADVGDVREGQAASFTVDAYPNRTYHAIVQRVRLGSTKTSGIVSYKAVLTFTNDDLSLRPGMTGNAVITTLNRENVLLLPAAAFRWSPPDAGAGAPAPGSKGGLVNSLMPRPPDRDEKKTAGIVASTDTQQTVWVLRDGKPAAVIVKVGASNGRLTEVTSGNLEPGAKVITETAIPSK
jgi:HlyD family secretion protein